MLPDRRGSGISADSVLTLLGPDRWELAYSDDHGHSLASCVRLGSPGIGRLLPCAYEAMAPVAIRRQLLADEPRDKKPLPSAARLRIYCRRFS